MNPNAANLITLSRIAAAAVLAFVPPCSGLFWLCYLWGGVSDLLDGMVARLMKHQSPAGARLDSIADLILVIALLFSVLGHIHLPGWLWQWIVCIALLRIAGYGIGLFRYRAFSALHTYANKAAGVLVFLFPLLYKQWGAPAAGAIVCFAAFAAALEELVITVTAETLDRERRSYFIRPSAGPPHSESSAHRIRRFSLKRRG